MMRFFVSLTILSLSALVLTSCEDRPESLEEYLPRVETVSADVLLNGNLRVTGRLASAGFGDLYFAGFALDSVPDPLISTNQILADVIIGNEFTVEYDGSQYNLASYDEIYFKAFAVNEHGHSSGNVLQLEGENIGEPGVDVPCELDPSGATLGISPGWQSFLSISEPTTTIGGAQMVTATLPSNRSVEIRFNSLNNGLFLTNPSPNQIGENEVYISVKVNGMEYNLIQYSEVFINKLNESTYELVVCNTVYYLEMLGAQNFKMRLQISV